MVDIADNEKSKKKKPRYETPVVVPLGSLARGSGYCAPGSGETDEYCTAGGTAGTACTAGNLAPAACTAGVIHV